MEACVLTSLNVEANPTRTFNVVPFNASSGKSKVAAIVQPPSVVSSPIAVLSQHLVPSYFTSTIVPAETISLCKTEATIGSLEEHIFVLAGLFEASYILI